ncbi:MAG: hypothetical protein JXA30_16625 [Deltaproteobacteria bacterium]|nr:hypothetical protein [Deltaproteobacteria bacterium]
MEEVKKRFQNEYQCSEGIVYDMGASSYKVQGCGHTVTYICSGGDTYGGFGQTDIACIKESGPDPSKADGFSGIRVEKKRNEKGEAILYGKFSVQIGRYRAQVSLRAEPLNNSKNIDFDILIRTYRKTLFADCQLKIVSNGKRVEYNSAEHYKARWDEEIKIKMPLSSLVLFGSGQRVIGRLCDEEFQFTKENIDVVKEFLVYLEEERALNADQNEGKPATTEEWKAQDIVYRP